MVYELFYNQLSALFDMSVEWISKGVEILSFSFTTFFILMFSSLPFFIFFKILDFFLPCEIFPGNKKKRWR